MHSKDISSTGTSQKSAAVLSVENLSRKVSGSWIWKNISFQLSPGERLALSGSSGSGKSLLLRTLAGLDVLETGPSGENGSISFAGKSLTDWEMPQYRTKVGYIPQQPAFPDESVEDCFKRVFRLKAHQNKCYDQEKILFWLEQLSSAKTADNASGEGSFTELLKQPAKELSGGEAQLVALLQTLQLDPQVLLLDEPTASMDSELTTLLEYMLDNWQRESAGTHPDTPYRHTQRAWIWVSHNPEQLTRMCGQTYNLDEVDGK